MIDNFSIIYKILSVLEKSMDVEDFDIEQKYHYAAYV